MQHKTKTPEELKNLFQIRMQLRESATKRLQTIREETQPQPSLKELRKIGSQIGVKGSHSLNTKTLCERLGIPLVKNEVFEKHHRNVIRTPVKITLISDDGDDMEFPSMYNAAKKLHKNPGFIPYCIKKRKNIFHDGVWWAVFREPTQKML